MIRVNSDKSGFVQCYTLLLVDPNRQIVLNLRHFIIHGVKILHVVLRGYLMQIRQYQNTQRIVQRVKIRARAYYHHVCEPKHETNAKKMHQIQ